MGIFDIGKLKNTLHTIKVMEELFDINSFILGVYRYIELWWRWWGDLEECLAHSIVSAQSNYMKDHLPFVRSLGGIKKPVKYDN